VSTIRPSGDSDSHFSTGHLSIDLKGRSVRGGAVTFVGQGGKFFLQLGSTMVLARILTPRDFGLIAMVAAVTGFIMVFKDLGLSMATVQKAEINHGQVSTLFWINIAISSALMLITMALAPAVAWFYKEPRLLWVTIALASAFIFGGLTVQHQALLRRQMRFGTLATIDISSIAAGVAMGIVCGLAGLGCWSLVLMQLVTPITMAAGVWIASGWRPGLPVRRSGVREMLAFGGYLTGYGFLNYFGRNVDKILLGRLRGPQTLGIYTKAYSLLLLPMGQITTPMTAVVVPALSRLQNEPDRYRDYYLKAIKLIAYITMPLMVAMGVLSTEIIGLALGKQWIDAGPIFMIFTVAAVLQPVVATVGWVYVSLGQSRRMLAWASWTTPIRVLSYVIGLRWGAFGVAAAYTIASVLLVYPTLAFSLKHSPIKVKQVFASIGHPLAISIVMGLAMVLLRAQLTVFGVGSVSTMAISIISGGIVFLLLARASSSVWADINDIVATARQVFKRK